ncbi:MAG: hypothetical protein K8R54_00505 [Bacteroidales bacterium]|nr:hypothetical protein [Bacteroidales bacterium]
MAVLLVIAIYISIKKSSYELLIIVTGGIIWAVLDTLSGKRRHSNIFRTKAIKKLIRNGFVIEKINKYTGVIGIYKGYIFQIYFDWDTYVGYKANSGIVFNVFYNPPLTDHNEIDTGKIDELHKKYKFNKWSTLRYSYRFRKYNVLMKNASAIYMMPYFQLEKRMDMVVDILVKENLNTITLREVQKLLERNLDYGPEVSYYKNYSKKRNNQ